MSQAAVARKTMAEDANFKFRDSDAGLNGRDQPLDSRLFKHRLAKVCEPNSPIDLHPEIGQTHSRARTHDRTECLSKDFPCVEPFASSHSAFS